LSIYDLELDEETGDIILSSGDLATIADAGEAIRQDVEQHLRSFKDEWFLEKGQGKGVDYFGLVLVKSPNLPAIRREFIKAISSRPGIVAVNSLEFAFDRASRELSITWSADTTEGTNVGSTMRVTL